MGRNTGEERRREAGRRQTGNGRRRGAVGWATKAGGYVSDGGRAWVGRRAFPLGNSKGGTVKAGGRAAIGVRAQREQGVAA